MPVPSPLFGWAKTCVCRKLDSAILMVKAAQGQVVRRRRRGAQSRDGELDRSRDGRVQDNAAKARHRPTTDRAQMKSHAPGDLPAPLLQGRTNKTAALDPAPTDPSWPVPTADRVNVRESLFAQAFNRLLQQNRHIASLSALQRHVRRWEQTGL
jgi:hypothetical protein